MDIELSEKSKKEIVKYSKFLEKKTKFSDKKIEELTIKFEKELKDDVNKSKHSDSIFPSKSKFGKGYKMSIDKKKHRVIFYKIVKNKDGKETIVIHECPHSKELKKELDKKGIKPLEDSDPQLLLDYITIEREDKVNDETLTDEERDEYNKKEKELESRIESQNKKEGKKKEEEKLEDKGKEEEIYDEETGKKVKRIVYTGPKGGRFYKSDNGEKVYIDEQRTFKSLSSLLLESKMISLNQYIK